MQPARLPLRIGGRGEHHAGDQHARKGQPVLGRCDVIRQRHERRHGVGAELLRHPVIDRPPNERSGVEDGWAALDAAEAEAERRNPKVLDGSRRRRIAAGSGTTVPEINRLLKQYQDMADMMKRMNKLGKKGLQRHGIQALLPGGGGGFGR